MSALDSRTRARIPSREISTGCWAMAPKPVQIKKVNIRLRFMFIFKFGTKLWGNNKLYSNMGYRAKRWEPVSLGPKLSFGNDLHGRLYRRLCKRIFWDGPVDLEIDRD